MPKLKSGKTAKLGDYLFIIFFILIGLIFTCSIFIQSGFDFNSLTIKQKSNLIKGTSILVICIISVIIHLFINKSKKK